MSGHEGTHNLVVAGSSPARPTAKTPWNTRGFRSSTAGLLTVEPRRSPPTIARLSHGGFLFSWKASRALARYFRKCPLRVLIALLSHEMVARNETSISGMRPQYRYAERREGLEILGRGSSRNRVLQATALVARHADSHAHLPRGRWESAWGTVN